MLTIQPMSNSDDNDNDILLEKIYDELHAIREIADSINQKTDSLPTRDEFKKFRSDVKVIKAVVANHEHRVNRLERRVA